MIANKRRILYIASMDDGRKRVIAIVAGIPAARRLKTTEDLFGGPQGSPKTDGMIAAAVQWAERIMTKIDNVHSWHFWEVEPFISALQLSK